MNSLLGLLAVHLPRAVTPTVAGLTVGAFVGVVGFLLVLFVSGRAARRAPRQVAARVEIAPYATLGRETPLPRAAFLVPSAHAGHTEVLERRALPPTGFRPTTELSARAFAKMYAPDPEEVDAPPPSSSSELEPVSVSPILVVGPSERRPVVSAAPHPLSIIPSSSRICIAPVRAASFADLDLDDGQTEIAAPIFDEPPQPRRRTDPPKIRPITPAAPRFSAAPLPPPTPPPARVRSAARPHS
ncbi:MAG: hypothetical protein JWP97_3768 [Labilithrix sp.]|nr:hypothetical protein [Labilithrix sp.]